MPDLSLFEKSPDPDLMIFAPITRREPMKKNLPFLLLIGIISASLFMIVESGEYYSKVGWRNYVVDYAKDKVPLGKFGIFESYEEALNSADT